MRIVSGNFRGKKLFPPTHNIRPTLDKVKQAFFTRLQFDIAGSNFIDLFSGSGAVGIEAISRNANKVVFCDNNKQSIQLTNKNIKALNLSGLETVVEVKFCSYEIYLKNTKETFDIIYIDPPYESGFYDNALKLIGENNLLNKNGILICERLKNKPSIIDNNFVLDCTKNYGTVSLDYYLKK